MAVQLDIPCLVGRVQLGTLSSLNETAPAHPNDDHNLFIEGFGTGNMHIFFFLGGQVLHGLPVQHWFGGEEEKKIARNFFLTLWNFTGKDEIKWTAGLETCRLANKHGNQQSTILSRMTRFDFSDAESQFV